MKEEFDREAAKQFLSQKETENKEKNESLRLELLEKAKKVLTNVFKDTSVEVLLVGSILNPGEFHQGSDVDIVLKGFQGDRFEIWPEIEQQLSWKIEIIIYEKCHFQDHVDQFGLRIR